MPDTRDHRFNRLKAFADEVNRMTNELNKESDRGAVLVGVAYLDELLIRLFRKRMLLSKKLDEELFEGFGPLSALSARIKVAYALGWIGSETYHDLNLLRSLRNEFAHAHEPKAFSDASVEKRCSQLELPKTATTYRLRARDQFLLATSLLAMRLEYYERKSKAPKAGLDPPVIRTRRNPTNASDPRQ